MSDREMAVVSQHDRCCTDLSLSRLLRSAYNMAYHKGLVRRAMLQFFTIDKFCVPTSVSLAKSVTLVGAAVLIVQPYLLKMQSNWLSLDGICEFAERQALDFQMCASFSSMSSCQNSMSIRVLDLHLRCSTKESSSL